MLRLTSLAGHDAGPHSWPPEGSPMKLDDQIRSENVDLWTIWLCVGGKQAISAATGVMQDVQEVTNWSAHKNLVNFCILKHIFNRQTDA